MRQTKAQLQKELELLRHRVQVAEKQLRQYDMRFAELVTGGDTPVDTYLLERRRADTSSYKSLWET